ncbi:hypothetical protein N9562_01410 [Flavobacteriaceae bacterium]|jgi:hypothetical protein|nr:hypothetical protein [Flavobacteriaceae bacterium]|tara:strand:- start:93 stop:236 length:144 start_codon:yes stop_codon:yes gene_type:complete
MVDRTLEIKAREIAAKFGCTDWQGLAIAVQIQQNETLEDIAHQIRHK